MFVNAYIYNFNYTTPDMAGVPKKMSIVALNLESAITKAKTLAPELVITGDPTIVTIHAVEKTIIPSEIIPQSDYLYIKRAIDKLGITMDDASHYAIALANWTRAGFPVREQSEVERIEKDVCRPCEHYNEGRCNKCGCKVTKSSIAIFNKIKMKTETCPVGKWT